MFCSKCGREIEEGASFCRFYGARAEGGHGMGTAPGGQEETGGGAQGRRGGSRAWKFFCVAAIVILAAALAAVLYFSGRNRASSIRMAKTTGNIYVQDKGGKDLSLTEIAQVQGISRQGVHDLIKRCDRILGEYEEKLHLLERFQNIKAKIAEIHRLTRGEEPIGEAEARDRIRCLAGDILEEL